MRANSTGWRQHVAIDSQVASNSIRSGAGLWPLWQPSRRNCTTSDGVPPNSGATPCRGCGAPLQTTSPDALGYIPQHLFDDLAFEDDEGGPKGHTDGHDPSASLEYDDGTAAALAEFDEALGSSGTTDTGGSQGYRILAETATVCSRCHRLRSYGAPEQSHGVVSEIAQLPADTHGEPASSHKPHIQVVVADVFDFTSSLGPALQQNLSPSATGTVLVVNKVDLLPADTKRSERRLLDWVRAQPEYQTLHNVEAIHLVSAQSGWGLPRLLRRLCKLCGAHNVEARLVGLTNAGKSTLVNRLLGRRATRQQVTTSAVAGTTLGDIHFRLICASRGAGGPRLCRRRDMPVHESSHSVYDTPGIIDPQHITQLLTPEEQRALFPARCKPRTCTIKRGQSLMFGGLARLDFLSGDVEHVTIVVFTSPNVRLHQTKTDRAKAWFVPRDTDEMGNESGRRGRQLEPPFMDTREVPFPELSNITEHSIRGKGWKPSEGAADIVLPGIGWGMVCAGRGKTVVLQSAVAPGHPGTVRSPLEPLNSK